ncbi:hypothetical protein BDM02DRAFT_3132968 [Thelephora ganbajun]|uniref:Uncharacterized protein n=1 Tax=Thelephora ganbajun TaxID=370292 RepID=A0ACB6YYT1_THEGA|nr:hypothetical protein BDM02DRAFT_3132968 [Thelephora ganbajun]
MTAKIRGVRFSVLLLEWDIRLLLLESWTAASFWSTGMETGCGEDPRPDLKLMPVAVWCPVASLISRGHRPRYAGDCQCSNRHGQTGPIFSLIIGFLELQRENQNNNPSQVDRNFFVHDMVFTLPFAFKIEAIVGAIIHPVLPHLMHRMRLDKTEAMNGKIIPRVQYCFTRFDSAITCYMVGLWEITVLSTDEIRSLTRVPCPVTRNKIPDTFAETGFLIIHRPLRPFLLYDAQVSWTKRPKGLWPVKTPTTSITNAKISAGLSATPVTSTSGASQRKKDITKSGRDASGFVLRWHWTPVGSWPIDKSKVGATKSINSIEPNDVLVGEPMLCTVLAHSGRRRTNIPSRGNSAGLFGFRKEPQNVHSDEGHRIFSTPGQ